MIAVGLVIVSDALAAESIYDRRMARVAAPGALPSSALLVCLALATTAGAQAPSPKKEGVHLHDGGYLRIAAGYGATHTRETFEDSSADVAMTGSTSVLDIALGGTLVPGLAVAGSLHAQGVWSPTVTVSGVSGTADAIGTGMIGVLVDGFPDPKGGFHVGGVVGPAVLIAPNYSSTGYGGGAFVGYDFWVADQWSLGLLVRASYASTRSDDSENLDRSKDTTTSAALMFSALYH